MKSFGLRSDAGSVLAALDRALAIIEFDSKGAILTANENFCRVMGYGRDEILGKHHSMFVEPDYARSAEYRAFWTRLGGGELDAGEYCRLGKNGKRIWIQASYNPIPGKHGRIEKVIKVAADVTEQKRRAAECQSNIDAISRAQAVIEFSTAGEILYANENFLQTVGYRLDEIVGEHHKIFVDPAYALSVDYKAFWERLNKGDYIAAEFKRYAKNGKEIWIQASYNPIFDANRRVDKIVKYATDITARTVFIDAVATGLRRVANKILTETIETPFPEDLEPLRADYNESIIGLRGALGQVGAIANSVGEGARQMSEAVQVLSRRIESQAANLEETAAALDQITTAAKQASDGAERARQVSSAAHRNAQSSADVVEKAVEAMDAIANTSAEINSIISVIDEIAFQTNLLALNAGVEAARAGDTGRGFAVVAQEVRSLAQRAAEAAKEIKSLISSSRQQVNDGVRLVGETGEALKCIEDQAAQISAIIEAIACSAREQSTALGEVNTAIDQMDQLTQQNAAMVEESTAASQNLSAEAVELAVLLQAFELGAKSSGSDRENKNPVKMISQRKQCKSSIEL